MIDLRTGVPGACKTLSAVEELAKMIGRWEKHPEEARPVFVHGVKELALPHSPLPLIPWIEGEGGKNPRPPVLVPDWAAMPDGSYCLIDEAQTLFPPRGSASEVPPYIAWLNTHRHRGFDITVITQSPKLVNAGLRALVGKHQHFRRLFGQQRAACYEWDACSDNLSGLSNAVTSYYPFPKKAFAWYKSAEIHTKQKFRLPKWLLVPVVGVVAGVFAFPYAVSKVTSLGSQERAQHAISAAGGKTPPGAVAPGASSPPVAAVGASGVVASIRAEVVPVAGCMATPARCLCVDAGGKSVKIDESDCRVASVALGGLIPYDTTKHEAAPYVPPKPEPLHYGGVVSLGSSSERYR